jgi:hypothetical protein
MIRINKLMAESVGLRNELGAYDEVLKRFDDEPKVYAHTFHGTVEYMSPELVQRHIAVLE